jgi:hypothetical protein
MPRFLLLALVTGTSISLTRAQCDGWQQRVNCTMTVDLDHRTHRFTGTEKLVYQNNSPDQLTVLFFHLYFNAFKPGSEMDVRSRTIADPDGRVGSRIAALSPTEQGDLHVGRMSQDGATCSLQELGTVLKVVLAKPIPPSKSTTLDLDFTGQVPVQIRRSGRDNKEGISYSMTQWYPKVAAYDRRGWHADPYVAREFYGEFGDFDVTIELDSSFTIAATGVLQNPLEIGHGYAEGRLKRPSGDRLTWRFTASNVHDFAWAADPDYVHVKAQVPDGPLLHFFYQDLPEERKAWANMPDAMVASFSYMNEHFGKYPYPEFSFAQGGDGGMEYPMLTLIVGKRSPIGVGVHESNHNWFYGVLASDEGSYPWMDEGFTEYATSEVMAHLGYVKEDPHADAYQGYFRLQDSTINEPMSLHADHYATNFAYSVTAYSKGEMFLAQLRAVIGQIAFEQGMLDYFNKCKFTHPDPVAFERVMEQRSGLELNWYFNEWINSTRSLDYAVDTLITSGDSTTIELRNKAGMVMPLDVEVVWRNGRKRTYHIPLSLTLGAKAQGSEPFDFLTLPTWQWTDPTYRFTIAAGADELVRVTIDPLRRLADVDRSNNER